jgi:hypothetical protein
MALYNRHTQNSPRQQQRRQRPSARPQETPPINLEDLDSHWPPIEDFSNETPAQREERLAHEREAKRISDEIDAQLEAERTERRKRRPDIRIILLGKFSSSLLHSLISSFPLAQNFTLYECFPSLRRPSSLKYGFFLNFFLHRPG